MEDIKVIPFDEKCCNLTCGFLHLWPKGFVCDGWKLDTRKDKLPLKRAGCPYKEVVDTEAHKHAGVC